jgi:alpha-ketoglutarate-dependent taurine dioxygenase
MNGVGTGSSASPNGAFDLARDDLYRGWRDAKLAAYPGRLEDLVVEVHDPRRLSPGEREALVDRCRRANMALYASPWGGEEDKELLSAIGRQLGLVRIDHNLNADEDAVTPLRVATEGPRRGYIPYTSRAIDWHTDGYYNAPEEQVRGFVLHCVYAALEGGENALLDPEIAYVWLRDHDPELVRALMALDVMTIPANADEGGEIRPDRTGPVFSVPADGRLHMRYTRRKRNVVWRADPAVQAALERLEQLFASSSPYLFRARLEPGWGLVCNNVLHTRTAFTDGPDPSRARLLYRGRYYDRVAGT